jgi:hypothetical protein
MYMPAYSSRAQKSSKTPMVAARYCVVPSLLAALTQGLNPPTGLCDPALMVKCRESTRNLPGT